MRNRVKGVSRRTRQFIDEQAGGVTLPPEEENKQQTPPPPAEEPNNESNQEPPVVDVPADDDSWLDGLTPYQPEPVQQTQQVQQQQTYQPPAQEPDDGTEEQKKRLAELYAGLEHTDEDVAAEIHTKLVAPELAAVKAELAEMRKHREEEQQARQRNTLIDINTKIFSKYPKAQAILNSKEFMDYLNTQNNPYSRETEHDILTRAYYAGDANYVLSKIDGFAEQRGKPKPQVGAEPHQGRGRSGVSDAPQQKKPMTDAEYLAKRKAIKAAPKGTYPPNALKDLVNEYLNSRG